MRIAELCVAAFFGVVSLSFLYMAQIPPLVIGWEAETGPGSGAFPFWLSLAMFMCSVAIFIRAWSSKKPKGDPEGKPVFDRKSFTVVVVAVGSIFLMLLLTHLIGAYFSIFLFLFFYIRLYGKHGWLPALGVSVFMPIILFFFFEAGMTTLLPKGYSEPLFLPLYPIFVY